MPAIRNRASHGIYVARLGRHLEGGEVAEVTKTEFDALQGHPLLIPVEAPKKAVSKKEGEDQ